MTSDNTNAQAEFDAAFDKQKSPRIQAQIIHLLSAIYYRLGAIQDTIGEQA